MKTERSLKRLLMALTLSVISIMIFSSGVKAGVDSYSIFLNGKLLLTQSVIKPLALQNLQLNEANQHDEIVIYYTQCNAPNKIGSGRSLIIKAADGKIIKEWKFEDVKTSDTGMRIPVKELLALQTNHLSSSLAIFYKAVNADREQKLVSL